jgi:hypothetical protein
LGDEKFFFAQLCKTKEGIALVIAADSNVASAIRLVRTFLYVSPWSEETGASGQNSARMQVRCDQNHRVLFETLWIFIEAR